MNKRQVIILWAIAILLGIAVAAVKLTQKDATQSATNRAPGQTLFEKFPAADIASVAIKGAAGGVTLTRKGDKWVVAERDDYPANAAYVNEFIRTLDELKVTRGMEAGPSFAPRFGMDESAAKAEDRGLTVVFKDAAGKDLATVSLGKNIESGADAGPMGGGGAVGRYIRNHADESGFYAISEMFPAVNDEPSRWLADGFFSPEKIKSITLSAKNSGETAWKVTRDTEEAEFKLEGAAAGEVLDTTAAAPLKSLLSYARFNDVVPADKVAERAGADGKRKAVIETFEGFTYTLDITPAKAAAAPAADAAAPPASEDMLLSVSVAAELPKERKKEEGEKEEDAKTKDAAFTERLKTLTEKLEKEKAFEGRTFLVSRSTVEALLKERADLITKAQPAAEADPNKGTVQQFPGGIVASPPPARTATTPPVEAVTPPIAVPPLEEDAEKKDE
ncbi:MAG: DUF4340 domain-containing protein [Akkermansiaceae bacterium]|jgi:hypothetical protein|nr:DUF4340 domain-containing protein [Akkermansiaceae bacterium]